MGSFSWLKADNLTKVANIAYGQPFKFLIPKEFGGGFIKDRYQDYGYLGDGEKYDMYEILAFWNHEQIKAKYGEDLKSNPDFYEMDVVLKHGKGLRYDGEMPLMKEIDKHTDHNRGLGIHIGCYDNQIDKLKYPLKLVSCSYKGTYEDLDTPSYGDPNQGWGNYTRSQYARDKQIEELMGE